MLHYSVFYLHIPKNKACLLHSCLQLNYWFEHFHWTNCRNTFNNSPDNLPTHYRTKKDLCFTVHSQNSIIDCFKQTSRRRPRTASNGDRFWYCVAKSRSVRLLSITAWTPGARFRPGVFLECMPKNCALTRIEEKKIDMYCAFLRISLMLAITPGRGYFVYVPNLIFF